jgi:hypothetical protein
LGAGFHYFFVLWLLCARARVWVCVVCVCVWYCVCVCVCMCVCACVCVFVCAAYRFNLTALCYPVIDLFLVTNRCLRKIRELSVLSQKLSTYL